MYLMKCWWTIRLTCTWLCVQSLRNKFDEAKKNCQSCFLKHGRWKYYFGISNLWEAFPSGLKPLFQREAKCKAIDMKIIFDSHRNKTHFQNVNKDFAHSLVLKVKVFGIRKWPTPLETSCGGVCGRAVTPWTLDLEVRGSSLARRVLSLDKEIYTTLSLFTRVYKWVPATYCWWGNATMD